jgi:hypothetical protein
MEGAKTDSWAPESDPIVGMLLRGEADNPSEAEERYLDSHIEDIVKLVSSSISEEEFRRHPLIVMLLSHGSREWEDSLA